MRFLEFHHSPLLSLFLPNAASLVIIRYLPCVPHPSLQLALTFFFDTLIAGDLYHPPVSAFDLQSPRRFTAPCIVLGTKTLRPQSSSWPWSWLRDFEKQATRFPCSVALTYSRITSKSVEEGLKSSGIYY